MLTVTIDVNGEPLRVLHAKNLGTVDGDAPVDEDGERLYRVSWDVPPKVVHVVHRRGDGAVELARAMLRVVAEEDARAVDDLGSG